MLTKSSRNKFYPSQPNTFPASSGPISRKIPTSGKIESWPKFNSPMMLGVLSSANKPAPGL